MYFIPGNNEISKMPLRCHVSFPRELQFSFQFPTLILLFLNSTYFYENVVVDGFQFGIITNKLPLKLCKNTLDKFKTWNSFLCSIHHDMGAIWNKGGQTATGTMGRGG